MDVIGAIKAVATSIGEVFGYMRDRSKLNNSPEMQQADKAQKEVTANSEVEKHLADKDLNKIRQDLSE